MVNKHSLVYAKYMADNRCPRCGKFIWYSRDYVNGVELRGIRFGPPPDPSAVAECPKCLFRWPVYERETLLEIQEGPREAAPAFTDSFVLDNTRGTSALHRTKSIRREWARTVELSAEHTQEEESGVDVGVETLSLTAVARNTLVSRYHDSRSELEVYSDELTFEVPPGVSRQVLLEFDQIWQTGQFRILSDDETTELPFRIVVGLELNVRQIDTASV